MRVRETYYRDYGLSDERVAELKEFARKEENRGFLSCAAEIACSYLANYLVESLATGRGYRTIFKYVEFLPCGEDDFLGYKCKTIVLFGALLEGQEPVVKLRRNK